MERVILKAMGKMLQAVLYAALLSLGSFGARAMAQEHGEEHGPEAGVAEHAEHEFHRHHFSVFLGVTAGEVEKEAEAGVASEGGAVIVEDETAFTLGLDYEYRLSRRWGVGALAEWAGKDARFWVVGIPAAVLHPKGGLKLYLVPGFEKSNEHDAEFLVRLGAMYDFEVGRFTIAPAFNVDFVDDEEVLVYGVNIGRGF
jgi:hypothetical protein